MFSKNTAGKERGRIANDFYTTLSQVLSVLSQASPSLPLLVATGMQLLRQGMGVRLSSFQRNGFQCLRNELFFLKCILPDIHFLPLPVQKIPLILPP